MTILRSCILTSCLLVAAAPSRAQTSSIHGRVTLGKQPLASATVSAYLLDAKGTRSVGQWATFTATDGTFTVKPLRLGTYVVVIRYQGRSIFQRKVQVTSAAGPELDVNLKPAAH